MYIYEHAVLHFNVTRESTSDEELVCGLPHGGLQRSRAVFGGHVRFVCGRVRSCAVACDLPRSRRFLCGPVRSRAAFRGPVRSSTVECGRVRSRAVVCGRVRSCAIVCGRVRSRAVENISY